jgi:acetolactate synthase-1/2/3 large subunit
VAERPVILVGSGVRLSGAHDAFITLIERLGIPSSPRGTPDALWNDHPRCRAPRNRRRPGRQHGDAKRGPAARSGKPSQHPPGQLQLAELRPRGVQIWVDIDPLELRKPTVRPGIPVVADLADLLPRLNALAYGADHGPSRMAALGARTQCAFPTVLPEYRDHGPTNHPYVAMDALFDALDDDDIVVTGNGSACVVGFQVARIQKGQRLWTNSAVRRWAATCPPRSGLGRDRR